MPGRARSALRCETQKRPSAAGPGMTNLKNNGSRRLSPRKPEPEARLVEEGEAVMAEPSEVGVEEGAQVRDAVFQHRDALDPHAEGEALIAGAVDAAHLQHLGMHHPAAEDLQPVAMVAQLQLPALARAADIGLRRGLGEGE